MEEEGRKWDALVEDHLISTGLFCGIVLLTDMAECVYSYGLLCKSKSDASNLHQQTWKEFTSMFVDEDPIEAGLELELEDKLVKFIVFKKNLSSVYATSEGKLYSLLAFSLPQAVLLCISKAPTPISKALAAAETFTSTLK